MPAVFPEVTLEGIGNPSALNLKRAADGKRYPAGLIPLLEEAARTLPRPSALTIIVTADLAGSVNHRFVAAGFGAIYETDRGVGMVSAKTVQVQPDQVEMIVPAWLLVDARYSDMTADQEAARDQMSQWTLMHELQHALTSQRDGDRYLPLEMPDQSTTTACVINIAQQVQDEFRAEAATTALARRLAGRSGSEFIETLEYYHQAMRAAYQRRRLGLDLFQLSRLVLRTASSFCVALAYLAADLRSEHGRIERPVPDLEQHPLWLRHVAPVWGDLCTMLEKCPVDRAPRPDEIPALREALAEWVFTLLAVTGFDMTPRGSQERIDFLDHVHEFAD